MRLQGISSVLHSKLFCEGMPQRLLCCQAICWIILEQPLQKVNNIPGRLIHITHHQTLLMKRIHKFHTPQSKMDALSSEDIPEAWAILSQLSCAPMKCSPQANSDVLLWCILQSGDYKQRVNEHQTSTRVPDLTNSQTLKLRQTTWTWIIDMNILCHLKHMVWQRSKHPLHHSQMFQVFTSLE